MAQGLSRFMDHLWQTEGAPLITRNLEENGFEDKCEGNRDEWLCQLLEGGTRGQERQTKGSLSQDNEGHSPGWETRNGE